jgi:KDO2-lipid IV(A) lauroyltransferase
VKPWLIRVVIWLSNLHREALVLLFAVFGPTFAYRVTECLARLLYWLLPVARQLSQYHCRAALANDFTDRQIRNIAEQAFVHRMWNLVDLMLAKSLVNRRSFTRFGGLIPEPERRRLHEAQRRRKPTILLTAYYGSYDLLPMFLGFDGLDALAVYRPHANQGFDRFRQQVRASGGCRFVAFDRAAPDLAAELAAGGTIALVADHHMAKGIEMNFLGLPTRVPRTIGLLAWRYEADVIVAVLKRLRKPFRFRFEVVDIIEWPLIQAQDDPVDFTVRRYVRSLERAILQEPAQYLWTQPRWGKDLALEVIQGRGPSARR